MQDLLNKLSGKSFKYCGRVYTVNNTKIVNQKAVILTNIQTFSKTLSELEAFMDDILFIKVDKAIPVVNKKAVFSEIDKDEWKPLKEKTHEVEQWKPSKEMVVKLTPHIAEIVAAETTAVILSNKLMDVFNELSTNPTETTFKKATAMVGVSNSIINVQLTQMKFWALKK